MQNETTSAEFSKFGTVYKNFSMEGDSSLIRQIKRISPQRFVSQFLHFNCDTYIEVQSGIGVILVCHDPENSSIKSFSMNRQIHLKPNVYFAIAATTPELVIHLYTGCDYALDVFTLTTPYEFQPILPRIQIQDILGYYYRIRTPDYFFKGESHDFFELTYVDTGSLCTEVDGCSYTLKEKEMIIYGPGQFHNQRTGPDQTASYVTILFTMNNASPNLPANWYNVLINRVFPFNKKIHTLIKTIVQESTTGIAYMDSLMHCLLTETIIRLLQATYVPPSPQPTSTIRQNYQEELFERILSYIETNICEPLTIAEICQHFSLSRSSLQILFKNAVNQSPKKFISDTKLEKSCQMLRENKYTISEISLKLGYSSIHYFSNAFNQKYHMSPSEYARRIY